MPHVILMCGYEVYEEFDVADGITVRQIVRDRYPETGEWPTPTICICDGELLLRENNGWESAAVCGDSVVVFAEIVMNGGGGSNPMQAVMMVAIAVAAAYTGGAAATAAGAAWGSTAGAIAGAAASTAVTLAGGIISNAIFGSAPSGQMSAYNAESSSPTYSINGSTNQARLWQPVPEGFGRMRVVADLAANKWMQYIGNEMYLYQVFACGRGLYHRHALYFGDIKIWEEGRFIESAYTTESGEQYVNRINKQIVAVADGGNWYGPYPAVAVNASAVTLNLTVNFPDGLAGYRFFAVNPETEEAIWAITPVTASFVAQYQEIDNSGTPVGEWQPLAQQSVTKGQEAAFSLLMTGNAPVFGRYRVRVQNTSVIPDSVSYTDPDTKITYTKTTRKKAVLDNVSSTAIGVEIQIVEPGETVTLFPDNVEVSIGVASQEMYAPNEAGHDWIGPYPVNSPGTRVTQILYSNIMPSGLGQYDSKGRLRNFTVTTEIQIQEIDDYGNPVSDWTVLRTPSYTAATLTAQRKTETCEVPSGRYQSRQRRISNKGGGQAVDIIQWESMTGVIPGSLSYDQTTVAVKIRASNILSQNAASSFALLQTRMLELYDRKTKTWSEKQPTRSFAAAASWVCKAYYGGGLSDRQIDLDTLWRLDEELQEKGWHYDAWIDGAYLVWPLLVEMCRSVRVVPRPTGGVLSFIMDKSGRPVRHTFTPRDIVRGSFALNYNTFEDGSPDDVIMTYLDEGADYLQRDVRAILPESESRSPSTQTILGITNRDHGHDLAVFMAACNRWRRTKCEFETEGVGRVIGLGDVVTVEHPRLKDAAFGILSGWDASALILHLAATLTIVTPEMPYMSLTRPDGTPWGPVKLLWVDGDMVRFDPEDYAVLIMQGLESPFDWLTVGDDCVPTAWTIQSGREYKRRFIVTGIAPQSMYRHRITLINDSDMVDSYDIPTPAWGLRSNLPIATTLSAPGNLRATITEATSTYILAATWDEVNGATAYEVETSSDGITWVRYGRVNTSSIELPTSEDTAWLHVATIRGYEQSSWSTWQGGQAA